MFDEADLDAALARFDELHSQARRLENAASRVTERSRAALAARDWDAVAEWLTEGYSTEDRRRVVNTGTRRGRDVGVKDIQAAVDVIGMTYLTSVVIATRGERLELTRAQIVSDERHVAAQFEILQLTEIDADERIAAVVTFDGDDIDAALEELDARYLAGEAATHAHTWSVIANAYAAFNRHELPAATSDWVNIDHRPVVAFEAGNLAAYLRAAWKDLSHQASAHVESVHRLSNLGAVVTQAGQGISQEGFDAEWRMIAVFTVDGEMISRCELYDEADIDEALARFDELHEQARRPENTASRVGERYTAHFGAGDWDGMAEILADDFSSEDRRRVVGAGVRHGRDAEMVDMRAIADLGLANVASTIIATRGARLALSRARFSGRNNGPEAFLTEVLAIVEIDTDERIVATVTFDPDDMDNALEELDARYLAGEAAAHARTWSVISDATTERSTGTRLPQQRPTWIMVDHRPIAHRSRSS